MAAKRAGVLPRAFDVGRRRFAIQRSSAICGKGSLQPAATILRNAISLADEPRMKKATFGHSERSLDWRKTQSRRLRFVPTPPTDNADARCQSQTGQHDR